MPNQSPYGPGVGGFHAPQAQQKAQPQSQAGADGGMNPWLMLLAGLAPMAMNYFGGGAKGVEAAPKIDDPMWGRIPNPEYEQQAQQSQWQAKQRQSQLQQLLMAGLGMWLMKNQFGGGDKTPAKK